MFCICHSLVNKVVCVCVCVGYRGVVGQQMASSCVSAVQRDKDCVKQDEIKKLQ